MAITAFGDADRARFQAAVQRIETEIGPMLATTLTSVHNMLLAAKIKIVPVVALQDAKDAIPLAEALLVSPV